MKPVVTSIVALAMAIAPMTALAGAHAAQSKEAASMKAASPSKVEKHASGARVARAARHKHKVAAKAAHREQRKGSVIAKRESTPIEKAQTFESTERIERTEKSVIVRVHHGAIEQPERRGGGIVIGQASPSKVVKPGARGQQAPLAQPHASASRSVRVQKELPTLPAPDGRGVSGVGAKATKKASAELGEGRAARDELKKMSDDEVASLVQQIRGQKAITLASATERVKGHTEGVGEKVEKVKAQPAKKTCAKTPVAVIRGPELEEFPLTRCDGSIAPLAIERLSVLVRPGSAARPTVAPAELAKKKGAELAQGIRRIDERLAYRLQSIVDHFTKPGEIAKVDVISGYRPTSVGSMHATGRAIDFRLEGVKNADVVSFCKTLNDTGCGYYPNSSFVHIDVREPGAGHVAWIDASGPGETPRYVPAWPPARRAAEPIENVGAREPVKDVSIDEVPVDEHPEAPIESADITP